MRLLRSNMLEIHSIKTDISAIFNNYIFEELNYMSFNCLERRRKL